MLTWHSFRGQVPALTLLHTVIIVPLNLAPPLSNEEHSVHLSGVLCDLSENRHSGGPLGVFS